MGAPLAEVRRERAREQRVIRADVGREAASRAPRPCAQRLEPLRQDAALRIEILRQRRREALGDLRRACREELAHLAHQLRARLADRRRVDLRPRRAQREHADAQGGEREAVAVLPLVPAKLGQDVRIADLEGEDDRLRGPAPVRRLVRGDRFERPRDLLHSRLPARLFSTGRGVGCHFTGFASLSATPECLSRVLDTARASRADSPTSRADRRARVIAV